MATESRVRPDDMIAQLRTAPDRARHLLPSLAGVGDAALENALTKARKSISDRPYTPISWADI